MQQLSLYSTAGQITAFQKDQPDSALATNIMRNDMRVEQVGFLWYNSTPRLQMMGGELCVNATLAAGAVFCQQQNKNVVNFYSSGIRDLVSVEKNGDTYSLSLPSSIIIEQDSDYVEFSRICFFLEKGLRPDKQISREEKVLLQGFGMAKSAAGLIFYEGNLIQPLVYVGETSSMVWETACGSGSLAFSLVSGIQNVKQPSGELISIQKINDTLTISASVKEIT
jgi:hypothetical protein